MALSAQLNESSATSRPANKTVANDTSVARSQVSAVCKAEAAGILALVSMAVGFLALSWRKWPDPIVDSGPQLYAIWRVSQGARLYHDFLWNYGPLSVCFNAALFKLFGPGIMVIATANLVFYAVIASLAYIAFRMAWGKLAAFAALAVFISVFSFSHLLGVGNYNFIMPYAAEATHGTLLILISAFIAVRWCQKPSRWLSFFLGLCGGLTAVMKPEFMLAAGLLGIAALVFRLRQRIAIRLNEFAMLGCGLILPTLTFTVSFMRTESPKQAFIDASQAWWLVLVTHIQGGDVQQLSFTGLNDPWGNVLKETGCALRAALVLGAIWAAGWVVNRRWSKLVRAAIVIALVAVLVRYFQLKLTVPLSGLGEYVALLRLSICSPDQWMWIGTCLPGLMLGAVILTGIRLKREMHESRPVTSQTLMAAAMTLLGAVMLARMPLYARVFHLGFFQAALAAMVITAIMVSELPRWTGQNTGGRWTTVCGSLAILAFCCGCIAAKSWNIRKDQTEPIGSGRDRIYSTTRMIDGTGALVNWASEKLRSVPPDATVLVLPEGAMINYLSRHKAPEPGWQRGDEPEFVARLRQTSPEYVVLISRELKEFGIAHFGAAGNPGQQVMEWVSANYFIQNQWGGDPLNPDDRVGAIILKSKK